MLPIKIKLNEEIIDSIKSARAAKRIPAAILSRVIKRDDSYISSLESKRLRTISAVDFIEILSFLYDLPEQKAIEMAEKITGNSSLADDCSDKSSKYIFNNKSKNDFLVSEPTAEYYRRWVETDYIDTELINGMLDTIKELFTEFYKKEPKETVYVLNSFIKTLQFDPIFTMKLIAMPFFALKSLDIDMRIKVLLELSELLKKHTAIAQTKKHSNPAGAVFGGNDDLY